MKTNKIQLRAVIVIMWSAHLVIALNDLFPPTLYCQEQKHKLVQSKLITLYPLILIENQKQNCLLFPQRLRVNALNKSIDTFIKKQLFKFSII